MQASWVEDEATRQAQARVGRMFVIFMRTDGKQAMLNFMATPAYRAEPLPQVEVDPVGAIRNALQQLLRAIPAVNAAFVATDGSDIRVYVVVADHNPDVHSALGGLQEALFDMFSGFCFDVSATAHQGKRSPAEVFPGWEPVYLR